jgi:hypothetical protein
MMQLLGYWNGVPEDIEDDRFQVFILKTGPLAFSKYN